MDDDWGLQAVVRGCTSTTTFATAAAATTTASSSTTHNSSKCSFNSSDFSPQSCCSRGEKVGSFWCLPDPFDAGNNNISVVGDLHELCKPFFSKSPQATSVPSVSSLGLSKELTITSQPLNRQHQHHHHQQQQHQLLRTQSSSANSHTSRPKRRKNQLKKICQVPAEALSSDVWAWRKYGQKPIKGSPYPRGYYRCSSSKGCLARKQVERNRSDPGMFIVTYTAEHSHPAPTHKNSLAGSTRQKTFTPQTVAAGDSNKPSSPPQSKPACSSPTTSLDDELVPQSTNTESMEEEEEYGDDEKDFMEENDDDEVGGLSETALSDDFFEGLEEFTCPVTGDRFSDHFPASFAFPWLAANNNAATAAGGL